MQFSRNAEGKYIPNDWVYILGPFIWVFFVIVTMMVERWDRKLFWLFGLSPLAFGLWLLYGYFALHAWLFGFAP